LLDLLRPTSGAASIFGHDCQADGLKERILIEYLLGELGVYSDLIARELLQFLERVGGVSVAEDYQRDLFERFELSDRDLSREMREYSTGMKRKVGLIQAFQANPDLLILDEPTEGLDPLM
jgi:ABC-2 type transport system ATP-binding protein